MSEPVRAEGRYVTVTSKPGAKMTQEAAVAVAELCDLAAELGGGIGAACQAYEAVFGREMLLEFLGQMTATLKEAG